jgi:protein-tyrosine phosphatase
MGASGNPSVLVVCTANICRSPMCEALLARSLATSGSAIRVSSAGLLDWDRPVDPGTVTALERFGIVIGGRRSRPIASLDLDEVDLVLTMTREHLREIVNLDPALFPRTFTLKEFDRRISDPITSMPEGDFATRVAHLAGRRSGASLLGASTDDDIADPFGLKQKHFDELADELHEIIRRVTPALVAMSS